MPIVNLRLLYGWLELAHATICMPVFHIREGASIISLSAARPGRWPALVHMNECISFKFLNDRFRKLLFLIFGSKCFKEDNLLNGKD